MAKFIKTDKLQDNLFIPLKLSRQIIKGTLAHTIEYIIDNKVDMTPFEKKIVNDETGRPAYDPRIMLKLILFAYAHGILSSRRIHAFAQENIVAMALTENSAPNFTVIAAFISGMKEEIETVFINILLVAEEMKLLGNTVFALDGCKLPSNAGKENSGTFSDLRKKKEKFKEKIKYLTNVQNDVDSISNTEEEKERKNKAVEKLEKKIAKIEEFLSSNEKKEGTRGKESQSNITDNESCKMKTSHGVIQGYNGQALVDEKHQVIVSAKAFGKGQDHTFMKPMLEKARENYHHIGKKKGFLKGKKVIADTGYFSNENLEAAAEHEIDAYIPDQYFRKRDVRFKTKERHLPQKKTKFRREEFIYDGKEDVVICPMGNKLTRSKGQNRRLNNFTYKRYIGKKTLCGECPRKKDCLRSDKASYRLYQIAVDDTGRDLIKGMMEKIDTPVGRSMYCKRMGIVEPVFANIRTHKGMDRFTLRGRIKVNIQWMLYCIVHNLTKIKQYGTLSLMI